MRRIYAFAIGLMLLVAPLGAATAGLATADPGIKPVDYQQATDAVVARGLSQRGVAYSCGGGVNGPSLGTGTGTVGFDAETRHLLGSIARKRVLCRRWRVSVN